MIYSSDLLILFEEKKTCSCVISTMCSANQEYQYINPSTQIALFSDCVDPCHSLLKIHWKIYQGLNDSSTNIIQWSEFIQNLHFFGKENIS